MWLRNHASTDRLDDLDARRLCNVAWSMIVDGAGAEQRKQLEIAFGMAEPEGMEVAPGVVIEAPSWWTDE